MLKRWGLGPVFIYESLLNARRWQVYAGRALFVLLLLVGMVIVWVGKDNLGPFPARRAATFQQMAKVGEGFFYALTGIQVSLVLLAAPAAAAGSICMDRARGTLLHMMVTDLSDAEIVLGKLGSRLAPVVGLLVCGVPVTALAALLGGIDFGALAGAFAVSMALAVLGCVLALSISVWATKTHEVLMAVYSLLGLGLLALPIWWSLSMGAKVMGPPSWFQKANPYVLVFAPYNKPGFVQWTDYSVFVVSVLAFSGVLVILSILRLRREVVEQSGRGETLVRPRPPFWRHVLPSFLGPSLDGNPVLWREWHHNRPTRLARRLWGLLLIITWIMAAWGTYDIIKSGMKPGPNALPFGFMLQVLFGFLMLSATAPTALAEERVRGSLDVLLSTPMSTRSIIVAKWWGMYHRVLLLSLLPIYTGLIFGLGTPDTPNYPAGMRFPQSPIPLTSWDRLFTVTFCVADFLASGAMIVSLGVALATWVRRLGRAIAISVIIYFLTAIGWIMLIEIGFNYIFNYTPNGWGQRNRWLMNSLVGFSPLAGPITPFETINQSAWTERTWPWIANGVVILIKAASAWLLFWLTLITFDRCLERVPERRSVVEPGEPLILEELAASEA